MAKTGEAKTPAKAKPDKMKLERPGGQKLADQPDLLNELYECRVIEQRTWAELAEIDYPRMTDGDTIDWRTLRSAMMRSSYTQLIPNRVAKNAQDVTNALWDKVDMLQMIVVVLQGRFTEWSLLHEKHIKAMIDDDIIKFTPQELSRLDYLTDEITTFFFRASTIMQDLQLEGARSMFSNTENGGLTTVGIEIEGEDEAPKVLTDSYLKEVVEKVALESTRMLEAVNARHREEGRGHYRAIDDDDDDSDE